MVIKYKAVTTYKDSQFVVESQFVVLSTLISSLSQLKLQVINASSLLSFSFCLFFFTILVIYKSPFSFSFLFDIVSTASKLAQWN